MGCCGQKRASLRARGRAARPHETSASPPPPPVPELGSSSDQPSSIVEYLGDQAVVVSGADGRLYTFSPTRRSRSVPVSDAEQLLKNPLFRQDERRSNGTRQEGR